MKALQSGGMRIAIQQNDRQITYSELLALSRKITGYLKRKELTTQSFVGVFLDDRVSMIVSMIGVINAGCVFVPIDPSLPVARLASICDSLKLQHLIVDKEEDFSVSSECLVRHRFPLIIDDHIDEVDSPEYSADDSVYVYFTSGTTGTPKGIVGKNDSLLQFIKWEVPAFEVDHTSRFSQFISPYFDAFLRDVFTPLLAGGTVCIPPSVDDFFSPEHMIPWIDENKITHIHCVPSLFRMLSRGKISAKDFSALKFVLMSGEKILPAEIKTWYEIFSDKTHLVNLYGPTEATMVRSCYRLKPADSEKVRIPIGKPIPDTQFLVLNRAMKPVGGGIPGNLYILSDYMTKGYLNAIQVEQDRFVNLTVDGVVRRAYNTGDRVRQLPDGNFELLGREDRQIKLNGIRVELDEIEAAILSMPGVKQVVVTDGASFADSGDNGVRYEVDQSLVAFLVKDDMDLDTVEFLQVVDAGLKLKIPQYLIPSSMIPLEEIPLLPNGKINYAALQEVRKSLAVDIIAPIDEVEHQLLDIWHSVLGDKAISTTQSFLAIGGSSLSILRLIGKIYKAFKIRISLSQIFNHLTIQQQAQLIRHASKDDVMTIEKVGVQDFYVLSAAQERIYYNYKLDEKSISYNLPMAWEILGDIQFEKIQMVFRNLIERHEVFRTGFLFVEDNVFQQVVSGSLFTLETIHCADTEPAIEDAIKGFVRPFDLAVPPLIRAGSIKVGEKRNILVVDTHHIVCDGMSQMNLLSEFLKLYNGDSLIPLNIQYKDYAVWEHAFKKTSHYLSHREFWLQQFENGIPKLAFPTSKALDTKSPAELGGNKLCTIDSGCIQAIKQGLADSDVTEFSVLFAVYYLFLSQISGQEDIVIGINTSGRVHDEVMDVIGMFAKTLPIRMRLNPEVTFFEFVKLVHALLTESNSHQIYDLADIAHELKLHNATVSSDLFDAMLVFQNFDELEGSADDVSFVQIPFESNTFKYPLTLFVSIGDGVYQCRFEYAEHIFSKSDMDILVSRFKHLVQKVSQNVCLKVIDCWGVEKDMEAHRENDFTFNF